MEDAKWKAYLWLSLLVWALALFAGSPLHGQSKQVYEITAEELTALETALTTAQSELVQSQTALTTSQAELSQLKITTAGLRTELQTLKTSWQEYERGVTVQRGMLISLAVVLAGALVYQIVTD